MELCSAVFIIVIIDYVQFPFQPFLMLLRVLNIPC